MRKHYHPISISFIGLLFFWPITNAFPQVIKTINDSISEQIFPLDELEYYEDTSNDYTFQEISSPSFSKNFRTNPRYKNKVYNNHAAYWIRLNIQHRKASE